MSSDALWLVMLGCYAGALVLAAVWWVTRQPERPAPSAPRILHRRPSPIRSVPAATAPDAWDQIDDEICRQLRDRGF